MALLAAICAMPSAILAQAPFVKLETVTAESAQETHVFFGRVVARETVDLAFQVGGQIVEYPLDEGVEVAKGDLVARMDQEPFELALAEATAQLEQTQRALTRNRELVGSAVSKTTLQDSETQDNLAQISVRNAKRNLENATLHAPFDGIVAARIVPNFTTVAAGSAVVRLHDMSDFRIEIDVPETLFQRASKENQVTLMAEFPGNDNAYEMQVREFNAETEQVGQTYTITLGMARPDGLNVLPGASAKVTATMGKSGGRIIVPASALVVENDRSTSVMVFSPTGASEGTVAATPVEITPTDDGKVEVLSGVSEGQEIVLIGANALNDGDTVRRFTGFGN